MSNCQAISVSGSTAVGRREPLPLDFEYQGFAGTAERPVAEIPRDRIEFPDEPFQLPRPRPAPAAPGRSPVKVAWQLRELAVERRTTVQGLLGEALNDLFQKHGEPEIASPGDSR